MTTTMNDLEQQRQSPGRRGINRAMQGESVNFSDYLNAQRNLKSQRFLQRRTSVRHLNVPAIIEEAETEEPAYKSLRSSRQLRRIGSAEWDEIFDNLGDIDENGQFHDAHAHIKPFYSPPVQRQRWGEDQVLPHVNWGEFCTVFFASIGLITILLMLITNTLQNRMSKFFAQGIYSSTFFMSAWLTILV